MLRAGRGCMLCEMETRQRPNVLWLSFEDTSPRFGCYGDGLARTPNVDRLATEGCMYLNAFSTAAVCAPSRCGVITGMYATYTGCHHMRTTHIHPTSKEVTYPYTAVPPPYVKCISEYLRAAGYYCTNNDKTDYQFGVPVSAWDECSKSAHWRKGFGRAGQGGRGGRPFFSVFNLDETHESGMWAPADGVAGRNDGASGVNAADVVVPKYLPDTLEVRKAIVRQYDNVTAMDARAGEILAQLEADGLSENTIVVVWSDHGEGLPRGKRWPMDAGTRVPLVVRYPGVVKATAVSDELVSLIDLGPTMLSLAGAGVPAHLQGRVFLGRSRDEAREYVFATRDRYDESYDKVRSVFDGQYRYVRNYYPNQEREIWVPYRNRHPAMGELWARAAEDRLEGDERWFAGRSDEGWGGRAAEELYDLYADPYEVRDLAGDAEKGEVLDRLRDAMDEWQGRCDRYLNVSEEEMVRQWVGTGPEGGRGPQPKTAKPFWVALGRTEKGQRATEEVGAESLPVLLQVSCPTEGASIVWRDVSGGSEGHWELYTGPLRVREGPRSLEAKAVRYGYAESEVAGVRVGRS